MKSDMILNDPLSQPPKDLARVKKPDLSVKH